MNPTYYSTEAMIDQLRARINRRRRNRQELIVTLAIAVIAAIVLIIGRAI